jgi:glycosyltransferase involved in cell wall biosynthesis
VLEYVGLVSTIIPVYNRPGLLVEAVESVFAQSYRPIEILIVNDGSTDDTPQVVEELRAKNPKLVRSFHQERAGPGRARQTGLEASRGEFVQYLDSDDLLLPCKFELQVAALIAEPECGAAYGKTRIYKIGHPPADIPWKRTGEGLSTMFPATLQSRWWSTSTPLYRRTVLDRVGPWTSLRNEEDWEYECRIAALGTRLAYCDAFVSDKRQHDDNQLSTNGSSDPTKLRDRAEAHCLIYKHARRAGISDCIPEMQHFARELFLLARQCGCAGLCDEAQMLFVLARDASGTSRARAIDFRLYDATAKLLGWTMAGRLACRLDRLRNNIVMLARR